MNTIVFPPVEDRSFTDWFKSISVRAKQLREDFETARIPRDTYIEACKRTREGLSEKLLTQVKPRESLKPIYKQEGYKNTIPAVIDFVQGYIDYYAKEIDRVSKNIPPQVVLPVLKDALELNKVIRRADGTYSVVESLPKLLNYFDHCEADYTAQFIRDWIRKPDGSPYSNTSIEKTISDKGRTEDKTGMKPE
jgi:hypothetical protein